MASSAHQFETERLSMRLLDERDKDLYCSLYTDPVVMKNISQPLSPAKAEKCFHTTLKLTQKPIPLLFVWVISELDTGELLGIQNISKDKQNTQQAEFGIMLSPKAYRKHIAFESIGALTEYGLRHLKLNKMYSMFLPENKAILRIAQKLNYCIDINNLDPATGQASCYKQSDHAIATFINS
ncbi:GNAT family N-acetyltransferase [Shewanella fidelis]|uniref:GNAT family N-acetyltransferase n=1 Tax=Shewanella fidelis TaxID=173509 RepID=UPI00048BEF09|nr:GNAT family N-acetyltransferase [Shewanella fidelis]